MVPGIIEGRPLCRSVLFAAAVLGVGLLTAGCSSETEAEQKTENANAAVCLSLQGLEATDPGGLGDGVTGTGDVTVSKAQESVNQIQSAYDTVESEIEKSSARTSMSRC